MTDELERIVLTNISGRRASQGGPAAGDDNNVPRWYNKVLKGLTSLEELLTVAQEAEEE